MVRITQKDICLVRTIAEYRFLTIPQITSLHFKSKYVARRRIKDFINFGFLGAKNRGFGRTRGRPERVIFLTPKGTAFLKNGKFISAQTFHQLRDGYNITCIDHQLLLNWFQIYALYIEKVIPCLKIEFISSTSPFHLRKETQYPIIFEKIHDSYQNKWFDFIPDGVFCLNHRENNKSLLFFVEIDMGTETIASPKRKNTDIRQKVLNYQKYFQLQKYKRYDDIFQTQFKGFRVLFMTNSQSRSSTIIRLLQEMPPSEFIWVSHQEAMFAQGLADSIWFNAVNGRTTQSILGTQMQKPSQLPSIK